MKRSTALAMADCVAALFRWDSVARSGRETLRLVRSQQARADPQFATGEVNQMSKVKSQEMAIKHEWTVQNFPIREQSVGTPVPSRPSWHRYPVHSSLLSEVHPSQWIG
jgi:hypothetical protein